MNQVRIRQLAERQLSDYRDRNPGTFFEDGPAITVGEAYAVESEVMKMRTSGGEAVAGYKVGCTGSNIRELFGLDGPVRGFLYVPEMHSSGEKIPHHDYANLSIEGELAVRLDEEARPSDILAVVELHNYILRSQPRTLQELIANNAIHAGVVVSEPPYAPWGKRPSSGELRVHVNGTLIDKGDMYGVPGGPEGSIDWLRGHLAAHELELKPGYLVLIGTPLGLHPVGPGDEVLVEADGLGAVACTIV